MREKYLATVHSHLHRVGVAGDVALTLAASVTTDMRRLTEVVDGDDLEARFALGWMHWYRYLALPEGQDGGELDAAVAALVECFVHGIEPLPGELMFALAETAVPIATAWLKQAMAMPGPEPVAAATDLWKRILVHLGENEPEWPLYLSYLGVGLQILSERTGSADELDFAVDILRQSMVATPADDADLSERQHRLARALSDRFKHAGNPIDLNEAIELGRRAAASVPGHPTYQWHLGRALRSRFEATGVLDDLDEAVDACRRAAAAAPPGHRDHAGFSANLASVLHLRFEQTGNSSDLDAAITVFKQDVDADPSAANHYNLATALVARFQRTASVNDLDAAISAYTRIASSEPSPTRDRSLNNLGAALRMRFEHSGARDDIDLAVRAGSNALAGTSPRDADRAVRLSNLGMSLLARFRLIGSRDDLDAAIAAAREALATAPAGGPEGTAVLNNVSLALQCRFEIDGAVDDIEAAVRTAQDSVAATPANSPNRPGHLITLMLALRLRFEHGRSTTDLNTAIDLGQEAVDATPADHPNRAGFLADLGTAFHVRYRRQHMPSDLDAAIEAFQQAVDSFPTGRTLRAGTLHNLGVAMRDRFSRSRALKDLDTAIRVGQQALEETHVAAPIRAIYLGVVGDAYLERFGRTRASSDLETAIAILNQAVSTTPTGTPDRAVHLAHLGNALRRQAERTGSDTDQALAAYRSAFEDAAARPDVRISSAQAAATLLAEPHPSEAADVLEGAVDLLRHLTRADLDWRDREYELSHFARLGSEAAALALSANTDQPPALRALRLLEAGRSILLSDHDTNTETDLTKIMNLAEPGPIVVLNVSRYRSDAILLTTSGISELSLPGLTATAVVERFQTFRDALSNVDDPDSSWRERARAQDELSSVLEWLWDAAAEPVLTRLGLDAPPAPGTPWPRIWWLPGGMLGLLPLHAAGYHRSDLSRTVLDRVVSSYAPTLRALQRSRRLAPTSPGVAQALVVVMPTTPGATPLPSAAAEADLLRNRIPRLLALIDPPPTRDTVLAAMADSPIVHFACHGRSDPVDPSRSSLLLHDHETAPLTVADLAAVHHPGGDLAYLSACSTALMNVVSLGTVELVEPSADTLPELAGFLAALNRNRDLLDEAIHLVSAFQVIGFRNVVGTLWEINDTLSLDVTDAFYAGLRTNSGALDTARSAEALHNAVRFQRDRLPRAPSLWASYLHAGS